MKNLIILLTLFSLCRNSRSTFDHDYFHQFPTKYNTIAYSSLLPPIFKATDCNHQQNQHQSYRSSPREQFMPPSLHEPIFSEKQKEAVQKQMQKEQQQFEFEKQQPEPFQQPTKSEDQPTMPEEQPTKAEEQEQPQPKQEQSPSNQQQFSKDFQDYQKRFQQIQQQEYQQRQKFKYEQQLQPDVLQRGLQKIQLEEFEMQQQQQRQQQQQSYKQNYIPDYFQTYNFFKSRNFEPLTLYVILLREPAPVQEFTDHIRPEPPAKFRLPKPEQSFKPMTAPNNGDSDEKPNKEMPNQEMPNQEMPNQEMPNQEMPNQSKFSNFENSGSFRQNRPEWSAKFMPPKPEQGFKPIAAPREYQSKFSNFKSRGSIGWKDPSTFLYPVHPTAIPKEDLKVIAENAHNYVLYDRYKHHSGPKPVSAQYFSSIYPVPSWGNKKHRFEPYHFEQSFVHQE